MNSRILTKSHAADPEIDILKKSILKPYGRVTAMPTAWELMALFCLNQWCRISSIFWDQYVMGPMASFFLLKKVSGRLSWSKLECLSIMDLSSVSMDHYWTAKSKWLGKNYLILKWFQCKIVKISKIYKFIRT